MKSISIAQLRSNLKKPLPGEAAHSAMEALSATYLGLQPNEQTRKSAVLMVLYPHKNGIYLPLILRNSYEGFHSGEVGFPGGKYEQTDENLIRTALREAREEIGIRLDDEQVLGTLTEIYIGPSNFLVLPVIGFISYRPDFLPDPREVKQIFEVKLDHFSDPDIAGCSEILIPDDLVVTPYYDVEGNKVWGATAKMIYELLEVFNGSRLGTVT